MIARRSDKTWIIMPVILSPKEVARHCNIKIKIWNPLGEDSPTFHYEGIPISLDEASTLDGIVNSGRVMVMRDEQIQQLKNPLIQHHLFNYEIHYELDPVFERRCLYNIQRSE